MTEFHPALAAAELMDGEVARVLIGDKKIGIYNLGGSF
jgi:hypothetical protein